MAPLSRRRAYLAGTALEPTEAVVPVRRRTATAAVNLPNILLVIQRASFHELAQREPHLGLVVMRNVAVELSAKLRRTNAVWMADRK